MCTRRTKEKETSQEERCILTINTEVIQVYQRSLVGMESLEAVLGDSS